MDLEQVLLTSLAASYNPPPAKELETIKAPKQPKGEVYSYPRRPPGRPKKNPESKDSVVETEETKATTSAANPLAGIEVGSLSATEFLAALQVAGKRGNKLTPETLGWDQRRAIHGFCGFSFKEPFGTQLDNAVRRAKTTVYGAVSEKPKTNPSIAGYVSGIPDHVQRKADDVRGRICLAQTEIESFRSDIFKIRREDNNPDKIAVLELKIRLEEERIVNLNKILAGLGFEPEC